MGGTRSPPDASFLGDESSAPSRLSPAQPPNSRPRGSPLTGVWEQCRSPTSPPCTGHSQPAVTLPAAQRSTCPRGKLGTSWSRPGASRLALGACPKPTAALHLGTSHYHHTPGHNSSVRKKPRVHLHRPHSCFCQKVQNWAGKSRCSLSSQLHTESQTQPPLSQRSAQPAPEDPWVLGSASPRTFRYPASNSLSRHSALSSPTRTTRPFIPHSLSR